MGTPGPDYWQNRADYTINARLDTNLHLVTGRVAITYYNNSPYELDFLWLQLEQNKYREDARGTRVSASGSRHDGNITEGMPLGTVTVNGAPATYQVDDTRLKIDLKVPVPPKNGKVELAMDYSFTIPEKGADRMGRIRIDSSWVYTIAQWYPRMAVLDPGQGWNNLPYLGAGEFYADYGTYDYTITVPSNMVVAGSGVLQNAREVLPKEVSDRLKTAASSDSTQWIIRPEEAGAFRFGNRASASWRFKMENTRDVAWACSSHFLWDAAPARLPSGRKVTTQSYYPPASLDGWTRATEYAIASLEHYSEMWYEYPYSTLSNVAGTVGGMEYPGLHFTEYNRSGNRLWVTLDHEVAHNWFPMIVGSNERQHAWMDESFVTFMGFYAARAFEGADYTSYISNHQNMLERFGDADFVPVMTPPRDIPNGFSDVVYFKPAIALRVLREYVLGPSRFDPAFKHYIKSWAYKHPQPEDFFRCMENASGDQLGWFWQSWFYKNEKLDQEITSATQRAEGELNILLKNRLDMPMPVVLQLTFEDGTTTHHRLPVEIWNQGNTHRLQLNYEKRVASLMIDPDHWLPDLERRNNRWDFDRQ
jgi:hypothetical protein